MPFNLNPSDEVFMWTYILGLIVLSLLIMRIQQKREKEKEEKNAVD